jgi:chromosome segregation ATPase
MEIPHYRGDDSLRSDGSNYQFCHPKIYSVDTIIEPGILSIINEGGDQDRRVYIDTPQNIKALIDVGSFENQILKGFGQLSDSQDIPSEIKFKTSIPEESNALKVSYETSNVEQGLKILHSLNKLLLKKYNQLNQYYKKDFEGKVQLKTSKVSELTNQISNVKNEISTVEVEYDNKIVTISTRISKLTNQISKVKNDISTIEVEYNSRAKLNETKIFKISNQILKIKNNISNAKSDTDAVVKQKANKIDTIKAKEEAKKNQIKNLQQRIQEIELEIIRVNKNTDFLIEERNKLLASEKDENNILSSVMYINTIQQNIGYLNSLKNSINNTHNQVFQDRADIERLENDVRDLDIQKENLVLQTNYRIDNFKSQINNLENDIKDLEDQNENLIKDKTFKIQNLKSQINNLDTDANELGAQRDNFKKQKKYQIATIQSQIIDLESQRNYTSEEIKILEYKKDNIQNILILKTPTSSPDPIKPKKKLIVILTTLIGIFMMVFLSFFLEYISKNKVQKLSAD